jgi:hypothetical protein
MNASEQGDGSSVKACMMKLVINACVLAILFTGSPDHSNAQTFSSSYTSTGSRDCRTVGKSSESGGATQVCPGKSGLVVLVTEDDLRETVSVGRDRAAAAREPAAEAWFAPFNSSEHTIEWRAVGGKPFAIIQRWHIADGNDLDKDGRPNTKAMLMVTRLPPGAVCHVAYVDVMANREANELARKAADEAARDFQCGKDQVKIVGRSGRAVELVRR